MTGGTGRHGTRGSLDGAPAGTHDAFDRKGDAAEPSVRAAPCRDEVIMEPSRCRAIIRYRRVEKPGALALSVSKAMLKAAGASVGDDVVVEIELA